MYGQDRIHVHPGEENTIYTYGLGGCTALAIVSRHSDQSTSVSLSHFPPISINDHIEVTQNLIKQNDKLRESGTQHEVLISVPGHYIHDIDTNAHKMVAHVPNSIYGAVSRELFGTVNFRVLPHDRNNSGHAGFILTVPEDPNQEIRYDLHGKTFGAIRFTR